MKVTETYLKGCFIIEPRVFEDNRGNFFEVFNQQKFEDTIGENVNFLQDNQSFSKKGVIRALHMQKEPFAQAKLVRVIKGKVLDIAVDVRKDSPTFGKHFSLELSEKNNLQLFIPKGFLHGFAALEDSIFAYKVDNYYDKDSEVGVIYNDETLNIDWGLNEDVVILSDKDKELESFRKVYG